MSTQQTRPPDLKRQYPHVDGVTDWRAQQSLRLLWDRVVSLEARVQALQATVGDLVSQTNTLEDDLTQVDHKADEALATAQATAAEIEAGAGEEVPLNDFGLGALGCGNAGATGDSVAGPLDVTTAGKIICGVGNEYPALLAATASQAARDANRDEILDRMVWHLNEGGFPARRYPTDNGRPYQLLFDALSLDGLPPARQYAYRVLTYDDEAPATGFADPMETRMNYGGTTPGETTPPDAGIAD